ncbi:MAG: hypothetical protein GJU72_06850 [Acidithiobacillus ferriphilus]|jgi:hypothetical protein|uniref:CFI-box-CTERM domain-containing protein n=1 Tax=Acidithiobacillus ferriphilus TaxID=1689834 RepID=UPI00242A7F74|nr:CFI-box-CTERM domain-containing protein [Acidithiobacillus ferriphilus]MBW9248783.1 hypothetical protein [Acidithiobacillus ferriphilus]MBW9255929.1 hypothetical protein [Acidithiobacillus ferriphilus]
MANRGTQRARRNWRGETPGEEKKRRARELAQYRKGKRKGPCFIATAVYGSPDCKEVEAIRRFRDTALRTNTLGRIFIYYYYKYSPNVANMIKHNMLATKIAKYFLNIIARIY